MSSDVVCGEYMSRILYTKETIQKRIAELGAEITQHYKGEEVKMRLDVKSLRHD